MEYRNHPELRTKISLLGYGTWPLSGPAILAGKQAGWGEVDEVESMKAIQLAVEQGINFFDTADIYGNGKVESLLNKALGKRIKDVIICTKFGNREGENNTLAKDFSPEWLQISVEGSLIRLGRDFLDILLLHGPSGPEVFTPELCEALEKLKKEGKIRSYGVSASGLNTVKQFAQSPYLTTLEAIYNVLDRRVEDEAFPYMTGKAFVARVPLASGFLSNNRAIKKTTFSETDFRSEIDSADVDWRFESVRKLLFLKDRVGSIQEGALRYIAGNSHVTTVIVGMKNREQVLENLKSIDNGALNPEIEMNIRSSLPSTFQGWKN